MSNSRLQPPSPNPLSSVLQEATLYVPSNGVGNDLWSKAYHNLPDNLKQHLGNKAGSADKLQTLQNVLQTAIQAKEANMANKWKLKWGDMEIDVQGTADRLVGWITKFQEIGDIMVQFDPRHAVLFWTGFRFILLVRNTMHCL